MDSANELPRDLPGYFRRRSADDDPVGIYFSESGAAYDDGFRNPDHICIMFGTYKTRWEQVHERSHELPPPDGFCEVPTEWDSIHQVFVSDEFRGPAGIAQWDIANRFPKSVGLTIDDTMLEYIVDPRTEAEALRDETLGALQDAANREMDRATGNAIALLVGLFVGIGVVLGIQWIHGII